VQTEAVLVHRVAVATEGKAVPAGALRPEDVRIQGDRFVADTNELLWDLSDRNRGVVTVNAPRSKAVIGYASGRRFDLAGAVIEPGPTRLAGWSAITLTVMEGEKIAQPCRLLITATGDADNTDCVRAGADGNGPVRDWGTEPVLVEGIPARITLPLPPGAVQAWALDERGQRKTPVPVRAEGSGRATITIGPEWKTLWYEVSAK
jgi:hypothetical protein